MWLEGVHGQSLDAFTVQSGWERVCGRVVVGGGPGPATIQGHGRLAPTLHCAKEGPLLDFRGGSNLDFSRIHHNEICYRIFKW